MCVFPMRARRTGTVREQHHTLEPRQVHARSRSRHSDLSGRDALLLDRNALRSSAALLSLAHLPELEGLAPQAQEGELGRAEQRRI